MRTNKPGLLLPCCHGERPHRLAIARPDPESPIAFGPLHEESEEDSSRGRLPVEFLLQ